MIKICNCKLRRWLNILIKPSIFRKEDTMNLITEVKKFSSVKEIKPLLKEFYIIEDYLQDEDRYCELEKTILNILRGCFHIKKCREYPIHFKFYRNDKE